MRHKTRFFLLAFVLLLIASLVTGVLILKSDYAAQEVCGMIKQEILQKYDLHLSMEHCALGLLPPALDGRQLEIQDAQGRRLFQAANVRVELDLLPLLAGNLRIDRMKLGQPKLYLAIENSSITNWPKWTDPKVDTGEKSAEGSWPLDRLDVEDGQVQVILGSYSLIQLKQLQISLLQKQARQIRVVAESGRGSIDWVGGEGHSLPVEKLEVKASWNRQQLDLTHFALEMGGANLEAWGKVSWDQNEVVPDLAVKFNSPLRLLHLFLPVVPEMEGMVALDATAGVRQNQKQAQGTIKIAGFGLQDVSKVNWEGEFLIDEKRLSLPRWRGFFPAGKASGSTELQFGKSLEFSGIANLEQVEGLDVLAVAGLPAEMQPFRLHGSVNFKGRFIGTHGPTIDLDTSLKIEGLKFGPSAQSFSLANLSLKAQLSISGRLLQWSFLRLNAGNSQVESQGSIRFQDSWTEALVQVPQLGLAEVTLNSPWGMAGKISGTAEFRGDLLAPKVEAQFEARDLSFLGRTLLAARGRAVLERPFLTLDRLVLVSGQGSVAVSGRVGLERPFSLDVSAELEQVPIDEFLLKTIEPTLPVHLGGWMGGQLKLLGSWADPLLDFKVAFRDVQFRGQRFEEGGAMGSYSHGTWQLELLEVRMGTGWLFAQGGISETLDLDLSAYSTGLNAGSFEFLTQAKDWVDFRLDLHFSLKGSWKAPALQGWAKIYDTKLWGRTVEDSFVSASATTESFQVEGRFLGDTVTLKGNAKLEEGLPFSSSLSLSTSHLEKFLPDVSGRLDFFSSLKGTLNLGGHLLFPQDWNGQLTLDQIAFSAAGLHWENRQPIVLSLQQRQLSLKQFQVEGTETLFSIQGDGQFSTGPRVRVEGSVGLAVLPLVTSTVVQALGKAQIELDLGGSWSKPELTGSASFSAEALRLVWLPLDLEEVTGSMRFSPQLLELTRASGKSGGGSFSAQGNIYLEGFVPNKLELAFDVDQVRYPVAKNLWGVGTGSVTLKGKLSQMLQLSGDLQLQPSSFSENVVMVRLDSGLFRHRGLTQAHTYDASRENLSFNLLLHFPDGLQVAYNMDPFNFKSEMKGELKLVGTNQRMGLLGELEVLEGSVFYASKEFKIRSAVVQFDEPYRIHPRIDIQAEYTESVDRGDLGETKYLVDLRLSGDGDNIQVAFKSNPPLDERDIITLLSLGVTSRDIASLKGQDLLAPTWEIGMKLFKLDERLQQVFPFPPEVIQPRYFRFRSRFSTRGGSMATGTTVPHLEVGAKLRLISEDLDLDYSRSLYDDTDQSVDLTYKLSEGVFTRLRWQNNWQSNIGDAGLDLKFHWEW